jgi:hypothetical protein
MPDVIVTALSMAWAMINVIAMVIHVSAIAALVVTPMALFARALGEPMDARSWLVTAGIKYATITRDLAAEFLRIIIHHSFNRTTFVAFSVYIGAVYTAAYNPAQVPECGAVIAMTLLWVVCDGCLRGFSYGLRLDAPLLRFMRKDISDIVLNIHNRRLALTATHE